MIRMASTVSPAGSGGFRGRRNTVRRQAPGFASAPLHDGEICLYAHKWKGLIQSEGEAPSWLWFKTSSVTAS
ncbi:hypothetical protein PHAMO_320012 [Magnetospirillum molischianum DSM 120]|uniref:Uncharacterized protein n=1 Tax=Magnetospirillum molischianum DSM 120 TaxID=1150626 RepID=H8FUK5_MAGML|nr:hypothetical protein PHAMO_320012 [Magnetospirillum molischianum DSM 120]